MPAAEICVPFAGSLVASLGMPSFRDLEAFKACHCLTLELRRVAEKLEDLKLALSRRPDPPSRM